MYNVYGLGCMGHVKLRRTPHPDTPISQDPRTIVFMKKLNSLELGSLKSMTTCLSVKKTRNQEAVFEGSALGGHLVPATLWELDLIQDIQCPYVRCTDST